MICGVCQSIKSDDRNTWTSLRAKFRLCRVQEVFIFNFKSGSGGRRERLAGDEQPLGTILMRVVPNSKWQSLWLNRDGCRTGLLRLCLQQCTIYRTQNHSNLCALKSVRDYSWLASSKRFFATEFRVEFSSTTILKTAITLGSMTPQNRQFCANPSKIPSFLLNLS